MYRPSQAKACGYGLAAYGERTYLDEFRKIINVDKGRMGYKLDKLSSYRLYNNRATVENRIKEQKLGFNLNKLPVHNKKGNEVYILLVALAYNILNWFKRFLFPEEFKSKFS